MSRSVQQLVLEKGNYLWTFLAMHQVAESDVERQLGTRKFQFSVDHRDEHGHVDGFEPIPKSSCSDGSMDCVLPRWWCQELPKQSCIEREGRDQGVRLKEVMLRI